MRKEADFLLVVPVVVAVKAIRGRKLSRYIKAFDRREGSDMMEKLCESLASGRSPQGTCWIRRLG